MSQRMGRNRTAVSARGCRFDWMCLRKTPRKEPPLRRQGRHPHHDLRPRIVSTGRNETQCDATVVSDGVESSTSEQIRAKNRRLPQDLSQAAPIVAACERRDIRLLAGENDTKKTPSRPLIGRTSSLFIVEQFVGDTLMGVPRSPAGSLGSGVSPLPARRFQTPVDRPCKAIDMPTEPGH